jgi:hypothetical protein
MSDLEQLMVEAAASRLSIAHKDAELLSRTTTNFARTYASGAMSWLSGMTLGWDNMFVAQTSLRPATWGGIVFKSNAVTLLTHWLTCCLPREMFDVVPPVEGGGGIPSSSPPLLFPPPPSHSPSLSLFPFASPWCK